MKKIKILIARFFSKKFKTRVRHFAENKYEVQWCDYRFIPKWHSLYFWFDQGHPGGTECWSGNLWNYRTAEKIASEIKSKSDLRKHYEPMEKKEAKWRLAEKRFWEKNVPYKTKNINR